MLLNETECKFTARISGEQTKFLEVKEKLAGDKCRKHFTRDYVNIFPVTVCHRVVLFTIGESTRDLVV